MRDGLNDLFTPEELDEVAEWQADAYEISVQVPASKVTAEELDALYDALVATTYAWQEALPPGRDWDATIFGQGPMYRKPS